MILPIPRSHTSPRRLSRAVAIAAIYLFAGFGIGAAVPADQIDPDYGMIYALQTMVGDSPLFKIVCIAFSITLFANMAAWSFGVILSPATLPSTATCPRSSLP